MFVYLSKLLPYLVYPAGIITILVLAGLIFCRSAKAKDRLLWLILLFVFAAGNILPFSFLIRKLEDLTDESFHYKVSHVTSLSESQPENRQLFYTIEILDEAISRKRQVELTYNSYGTDKKLHPHLDDEGQPKRQIINPYRMAAANGRYYLICNHDQHDNIAYYRIDRITDIILLDTPQKPGRSIPELKNGLDLPKHMAEHLYMFPGKSEQVTFKAKKYLLNDLIDWFGKDIQFLEETEEEITAVVSINLESMRLWALQYALHVMILEPKELREQVQEDVRKAAKNYNVE